MRYVIYRSRFRRQWRWKLLAANNRVIATSGESYANYADCMSGINLVMGSYTAKVEKRDE